MNLPEADHVVFDGPRQAIVWSWGNLHIVTDLSGALREVSVSHPHDEVMRSVAGQDPEFRQSKATMTYAEKRAKRATRWRKQHGNESRGLPFGHGTARWKNKEPT